MMHALPHRPPPPPHTHTPSPSHQQELANLGRTASDSFLLTAGLLGALGQAANGGGGGGAQDRERAARTTSLLLADGAVAAAGGGGEADDGLSPLPGAARLARHGSLRLESRWAHVPGGWLLRLGAGPNLPYPPPPLPTFHVYPRLQFPASLAFLAALQLPSRTRTPTHPPLPPAASLPLRQVP
jgi:hypothetical protein